MGNAGKWLTPRENRANAKRIWCNWIVASLGVWPVFALLVSPWLMVGGVKAVDALVVWPLWGIGHNLAVATLMLALDYFGVTRTKRSEYNVSALQKWL